MKYCKLNFLFDKFLINFVILGFLYFDFFKLDIDDKMCV